MEYLEFFNQIADTTVSGNESLHENALKTNVRVT